MSGKLPLLRLTAAAICAGLLIGTTPAESATPAAKAPTSLLPEPSPLLLPGPHRILPPYSNREAWREALSFTELDTPEAVIARAENAMKTEMEPFSRAYFLEFRKQGTRYTFERHNRGRHAHLNSLLLGEMAEGKGRFIPAIARDIESFCHDPTWVLSAHDGSLHNLEGRSITIDLGSAGFGWYLAEMTAALGDRLPESTQTLVWETLRKRIYEPYVNGAIRGRSCHWIHVTSNWNPFCHAGVLGTVLAMPDLTDGERTAVVRAAMGHVRRYFGSFTADGWSTEGPAYWSYGFSGFTAMSELIRRASGGKTDILRQWPVARRCALTTYRCYLTGGLYPPVCDSGVTTRPSAALCAWLAKYFDEPGWETIPFDPPRAFTIQNSILLRPIKVNAAAAAKAAQTVPTSLWLPHTQLMIGRSPKHNAAGWIIGGNNGVPHNHNDIGVYGYTLGNLPMTGDLGGEVYSSRTFSSGRYRSCLINSYGHAVPKPYKSWQQEGGQFRGNVLSNTPEGDLLKLKLDIRGAYRVEPEHPIERLEREFTWSIPTATMTVTDTFAYKNGPAPFETAATTWGAVTRIDEHTVRIRLKDKSLRLTIDASAPFDITESILTGTGTPTEGFIPETNIYGRADPSSKIFAYNSARRLGIRLKDPTKDGFIRLTYTPENNSQQTADNR